MSKLSWRNPRCLDSQRLRGYSIQDAESQLRLLLNQFPTHANAHLTLGILLEKAGHLNEALDHFAAAVENNPADQEARDRLNALNRSLNRP